MCRWIAIQQWFARLYPPKRQKLQRRRNDAAYPLHTAVLSALHVCTVAMFGGNTAVSRVTIRRENDTRMLH